MTRLPLILTAIGLLILSSCTGPSSTLRIPAQGSIDADFGRGRLYEASISGNSAQVEVAVVDDCHERLVRGFGLGTKGRARVMVEPENHLVFTNTGEKTARLNIRTRTIDAIRNNRPGDRVSFTLRNETAGAIPLIIPNVMNPNLSPFSNSGVELEIGQEILFREGGKRHILFTVGPEIQDGEVIQVGALMRQRRTELGLD